MATLKNEFGWNPELQMALLRPTTSGNPVILWACQVIKSSKQVCSRWRGQSHYDFDAQPTQHAH
jgi:hypothetical protein